MTYKENIRAILECCFSGFKDELIDNACDRIVAQNPINKIVEDIEIWTAPYTYYNHKVIDKNEVFAIIDRHTNNEEDTKQ